MRPLTLQSLMMLHFGPETPEGELRAALVECGRICYERRLMTSTDGNLSVRLDEARVLISPAGVSKGRMRAGDLLVVDMHGGVSDRAATGRPSTEMPMHLEVYKQEPEVRAVIHAHPVFATALTVSNTPFPADMLPEAASLLGEVPVTAFAMPSTAEDAEAVRPLISKHRLVLLKQHGSLSYGADLEEALDHLERLEYVAEVFWRAHALGHVERLSPALLRRLQAPKDEPSGV